MHSKIANEARRALIVATQKMSPAERLEACLVHSRLVAELREAGQRPPSTTQNRNP